MTNQNVHDAAQKVLEHFDMAGNEFWSRFPSTFNVLGQGKLNALRSALSQAAPDVATWQELFAKNTPAFRGPFPGVPLTAVECRDIEIQQLRAALASRDMDAERWKALESASSELTLRLHNSRADQRAAVIDAEMEKREMV